MTLREHLQQADYYLYVDIYFNKGATVENYMHNGKYNERNDFTGKCVTVEEALLLFKDKYLDMEVIHVSVEAEDYNEAAIQFYVDGNLFEEGET